ncbi:MAG: APC family permease [Parachlamydiales bacterium]|jgi:amino acid transporter
MEKKKALSTFMLSMMTVAMIVSLRGLPTLAKYGMASVLLYLFVAAASLIPVAFVAAELATTYTEAGGVFLWVSKAFSAKWGLLVVFLQWVMSVVWYPLALSVTVAMFAYAFSPALAENSYYAFFMVQLIFWGATLVSLKGLKISGQFASFAVVFGTLLPALALIISGIVWFLKGAKVEIAFDLSRSPVHFDDFKSFIFLTSVLLMYSGMEVPAVHVKEVQDPKKSYPKAIFLAVLIILSVTILGTLAIAIAVPAEKISLVTGLLQAFTVFFNAQNGLSFIVPTVAFLIALGSIGQISSWIIGPSKSLLASAEKGYLPRFLAKTNPAGAPVNILLLQAVLVSVFSFLFLLMPSVSSSFWILTVLTAQIYLTVYVLLFLAALKLRYSKASVKGSYRIPGGKPVLWLLVLVGVLSSLAGIFLGFFAPPQVATVGPWGHFLMLAGALAVFYTIPFVIYHFQKKKLT